MRVIGKNTSYHTTFILFDGEMNFALLQLRYCNLVRGFGYQSGVVAKLTHS